MDENRIVSLLPSATEFLCLLGARDQLVGVSHECDFPSDVRGLPVVTSSKVHGHKSSGDIHEAIQELLRSALGIYDIKVDLLAELKPNIIITQDLCDVCAVSRDDVQAALCEIAQQDVHMVSLHPQTLPGIWETIRQVGRSLGLADKADEVVAGLTDRVEAVRSTSAQAEHRPTVLAVEWLDPIMVGGLWMPEVIEAAGGIPLQSAVGERARTLDRDQVEQLDPDIVLLKPCGFTMEDTMEELPVVEWLPGKRVYVTDGHTYFNRPGPRIVDSLEILASILHPELFPENSEAQRVW